MARSSFDHESIETAETLHLVCEQEGQPVNKPVYAPEGDS